jgi:hypothetical protein
LNKSIALKSIFAVFSAVTLYFACFICSLFYDEMIKPQWQQEYENAQSLEPTNAQQALAAYSNCNIIATAQDAPLSFRLDVLDKIGNLQLSQKEFDSAYNTFDNAAKSAHSKEQSLESQFICERESVSHAKYSEDFDRVQTSKKWESSIKSCLSHQNVPPPFEQSAELIVANLYSDNARYADADLWFRKCVHATCNNLRPGAGRDGLPLSVDSSMMRSYFLRGDYSTGTKILVERVQTKTATANALKTQYEDIAARIDDDLTDKKAFREKCWSMLTKKQFGLLDTLYQELLCSKKQLAGGVTYLEKFTSGLTDLDDEASEKDWTERLALLKDWRTQRPASDAAKLVLADFFFHYGFHGRGHGSSNKVSDRGWKLLRERLAEAENILNQVKLRSPLWYTTFQDVALGQEWDAERYNALVGEGRQKFPDYHEIIAGKMMWLLPTWYGDKGDADAYLAAECAKFSKAQGEIMYAELTVYMLSDYAKYRARRNKTSYELFEKGMRAALLQPRNQKWIEGRAQLALFALSRKDFPTARTAFD